jgi:hypothetical protein
VATQMFSALAKEGINIQMISTSEIKISCIIDSKYTELAVRALHDAFELDKPASENNQCKMINWQLTVERKISKPTVNIFCHHCSSFNFSYLGVVILLSNQRSLKLYDTTLRDSFPGRRYCLFS